jgi:hypothetical protein
MKMFIGHWPTMSDVGSAVPLIIGNPPGCFIACDVETRGRQDPFSCRYVPIAALAEGMRKTE